MTLKIITQDGTIWVQAGSLPKVRKELRLSPREVPNVAALGSWAKTKSCVLVVC